MKHIKKNGENYIALCGKFMLFADWIDPEKGMHNKDVCKLCIKAYEKKTGGNK